MSNLATSSWSRASRLGLALALGLGLSGLGCGEGPIQPSPNVEMEMGTGTWRFEALTDGDEVQLVRGAQGGWHMWLALRTNLDETAVDLTITTQLADESRPAQVSDADVRLLPPNTVGDRLLLGWPSMLNEPGCLVDQLVRVHVVMESASGDTWEDERDLMFGPGADPPNACDDSQE